MNKSILIIFLIIVISGISALEHTPGQILFKTTRAMEIVRGRTGLTAFDNFLNEVQASNVKPVNGVHGSRWFSANLSSEPDWTAIKNNSLRFEGIEVIQPNYLNKMHLTPNDPWYSLQQLHLVDLPQAWNYTTGSNMIIVGVVDSGLLKDHPDLQGNIYYNPNEIPDNGIDDDNNGYIDDYCGWDFADAPELSDIALGDYTVPDNDVTDENFHGTHVSGILGAATNNGIGIAGVCWNVKILPIRAGFRTTTGTGFLQDDDAAAAIIYGADMGSSVMNLSWGDANYSAIIADACQYAYERGVTIVASAGNDPGPYLSYPAKLSSVISVGAIDPYRNLAGFSSYGPELDLVAPGQMIYSTYKSEGAEIYKEMSGTSMSSPFVAGAAALLKSIQPNLTPDEVKARLLTSTDDLGPIGFDNFFGHGLLNVRKLMENLSAPYVRVDFPVDNMGIAADFDIVGTVQSENFFRYSVMAALEKGTGVLEWKDAFHNTSNPHFYYQPVFDGTIARFRIHDLMPEGKYVLRIKFERTNGTAYHVFRIVNLDQTAPFMRPNTFQVFKRYDGQNVKYYAGAMFNEPVMSELIIYTPDFNQYTAFPVKVDSLQVWQLPNNLPQGPISVEIRAFNNSDLTYNSPLMNNVANIQYELVPSHGFSPKIIGNPMIPLNRFHDFDGNGKKEFLAMELPVSGYGDDRFYELTDTTLVAKYTYFNKFMPLDIGNTHGDGMELLALNLDNVILYETLSSNTYPTTSLWTETGISGGIFADYNNDGIQDILVVKNLPAERVIQLHQRISVNQVSVPKIILRNTTSTFQRNMFVPTIICRNLDGDNRPDILTADTDGDIMIFEATSATTAEMVWQRRMPVRNTYYLTAGDFDGNGTTDFFVGGYNTDVLDPNQNYWFFEGFTSSGDNQYTSMGHIQFNHVMTQNAIQAFDVDGDGKDEIILSLSPNLYILKYVNGKFQPIFYDQSIRTYQIACSHEDNEPFFITNRNDDSGNAKAVVWRKQDPFAGPPTPANFIARPLRHNRVSLSWQSNGADLYRIYRKTDNQPPFLLNQATSNSFIDTLVTAGIKYHYAVSSVNFGYSPSESILTQWIEATPMQQPMVTSITMIGNNELRVIFDQPLAASAFNAGCYIVDYEMGIPLSANSIMNQCGVQLRFRHAFPQIEGYFLLQLRNVYGVTGVAPQQNIYTFSYNPDFTAPFIMGAELLANNKTVRITISEAVYPATALDMENYTLTLPVNDLDNRITSVSVNDNIITINLRYPAKYSNRYYYIELHNITDLAGNRIIPNQNICKFGRSDFTDLSELVVYPNPVKTSEYQTVNFMNFPINKKGKLIIYNISGEQIYSASIGPFNPNNNNITTRWNLQNQSGKKVSSGIYYYMITMDGETRKGKIAVLN